MAREIFLARTARELERLSEEQGLKTVTQLREHELTSSASRWTDRHLIAYRLLAYPERQFLETFRSDHDNQCPVCKPAEACPQQMDQHRLKAFTRDPCPLDLFRTTESELMRLPDGPFWVALARASRPEIFDAARAYPQRERKVVEREDYIDSTTTIQGSSSPARPSSSEFEIDMEDVDEDEHDARRSKPEEVTVHLATSFLQHSLSLCLVQNAEVSEVRTRVERRRADMCVNGIDQVIAEDDGGICRMERQALGWSMGHPYLALLEAKRAFKYVHIDKSTGEIKPIVSNETVAQCFGEAVITWKANRKLLRQESVHSSLLWRLLFNS